MLHELRPVVVGHELHARRELVLQFLEAALHVLDGEARVEALRHLHDALHDGVVVVEAHDAGPRSLADVDVRDVADEHRAARPRDHDHAPDVVDAAQQADRSHEQGLVATPHDAAAGIAAARAQRAGHLVERESVLAQPLRIDAHLVFLHGAAEAHHLDDAHEAAQRRADHPVLQGTHLGRRHLGRCLHDVPEDLAHRIRQRPQRGRGTGRQRDALEFLHHLLAREVVVGPVGERHRHDREPEDRHRPHLRHPRDAVHLAFDRDRDRTLDLLRRLPRVLRDDLDLDVLDVGERLDRQREPRERPGDRDDHRGDQDEDALLQRERDDLLEHRAGLVSSPAIRTRAAARRTRRRDHSPRGRPSGT